ncbi:probable RNA methyltransferase CG11342 [Danaus plexippus]|uniref:probable RNA methyltransferase CG11342 n=1 Tax=Danaus plexippus TaxID=13037 RepID=UPI002AB0AA0C|nr:probable RNA methyltransferase CG11342 [Danaus plexippus]
MPLESELSFRGNDPGAAKYGNFINYYTFHSCKERTDNLRASMFPNVTDEIILCLDIGCNTGELTVELFSTLTKTYPKSEIKILAVDIDPTLIHRAQEMFNHNSNITFMTLDILNDGHNALQTFLCSHNKKLFDIIFCFSVTMWIHINSGDDALCAFLLLLKEKTRCIIIEPQPWKCYKNAQRRMKRSGSYFELFETLQIRDNVDKVIEEILVNGNFYKVYESPSSSWNRKIQSYHLNKS